MQSALIYEAQEAAVEERLGASSSIDQHRVGRPEPLVAVAILREPSRANLELHELAAPEGVK